MKRSTLITLSLAVILIISSILLVTYKTTPQNLPAQVDLTREQILEEFLKKNNASTDVAKAYRFALENPQNVLSIVRCYCGCIQNQGHKNNRDCFIDEDGGFDLMGLNCGLCVKTALTAKQMLAEGKSVQEISDYVDAHWGHI